MLRSRALLRACALRPGGRARPRPRRARPAPPTAARAPGLRRRLSASARAAWAAARRASAFLASRRPRRSAPAPARPDAGAGTAPSPPSCAPPAPPCRPDPGCCESGCSSAASDSTSLVRRSAVCISVSACAGMGRAPDRQQLRLLAHHGGPIPAAARHRRPAARRVASARSLAASALLTCQRPVSSASSARISSESKVTRGWPAATVSPSAMWISAIRPPSG